MSQLIPLSELPSGREGTFEDLQDPRIGWEFVLPSHVDQDRIALDVGHLRRLQKLSSSIYTIVA